MAARAGCWASRGEGGTGNSPPRWALRDEPLRRRGLPATSCPCAGLCCPDTVPHPMLLLTQQQSPELARG